MSPYEANHQPGDEQEQEKPELAHLLNANHRRVLATLLRRLERATAQIELLGTQQLLLTRFSQRPTEEQRRALQGVSQQLLQEIAQLAQDCSLEAETQDLTRALRAEFTLLWCDLEDARPHALEHYGSLTAQAKSLLEPRIARLIELVLSIDRMMEKEN